MMDSEANKVRFTAAWLKYLARGYDLVAHWESVGSGIYCLVPEPYCKETNGRPITMVYAITEGFAAKIRGKRRVYRTLRVALKAVNAQFQTDSWIGVP